MTGRVARDGVLAGAIGYAAVVLFYAALNLLAGRPVWHTADLLGRALLGESAAHPAPIFVYNGLHLVVFLGLGLAASWLIAEAERHPKLWYLVFSLALFVFLHIFGAVAAFAAPVQEALPTWSILAASLISAAAMGASLWRTHPGLRDVLVDAGEFEDPLPDR